MALNPSYATAHAWYGLYLNYTGNFPEALLEMQRAQQLDPLSTIIRLNVGRCYYFSRNYDTAIEKLDKIEQEEPDSWIVATVLGRTYMVKGSFAPAIQKLDFARTLSPTALLNLGILGDAYGRAGQRKSGLQVVGELDSLSHTQYVPPIYSALVYMGMGDKSRAFEFLDKAYAERSEWMVELMASRSPIPFAEIRSLGFTAADCRRSWQPCESGAIPVYVASPWRWVVCPGLCARRTCSRNASSGDGSASGGNGIRQMEQRCAP